MVPEVHDIFCILIWNISKSRSLYLVVNLSSSLTQKYIQYIPLLKPEMAFQEAIRMAKYYISYFIYHGP